MATIAELKEKLDKTTDPVTKGILSAEINKLQLQEQSSKGNELASILLTINKMVEQLKKNTPSGGVSKVEVEEMLKDVLRKSKIRLEDLDDTLRASLTSAMKVSISLNTSQISASGGQTDKETYELPIFQKVLSDAIAMNNIYLFGSAGTGKTFIAEKLAEALGYDFVLLPCNQFTSPLDVLGGQTIDGYQLGKLERAWGNLDQYGNPTGRGAVLCLDELPKIDPNTAGLLNDALAKVKNYKGAVPPYIENGRGDKIVKGSLVVIATGNVRLNETSTEYEANFKQDLSLQDRFVGSTYEVAANYRNEFYNVMRGFAFIWIAMTKLREKIVEMRWTGQAFVSLRILINLKSTYIVYREAMSNALPSSVSQATKDLLKDVKTLKQGVDSFLNLFKPDQITTLKTAMNYDDFIKKIGEKNKLPIDKLDTQEELEEGGKMVKAYEDKIKSKIA